MSRAFRHLTPRYVYHRLALMVEQRRNPADPWLTADSIGILKQTLKPTDVGVEFGSGRSTLWFAKRLAHLTSVEHDPAWFDKVGKMIDGAGLAAKVSYYLEGHPAGYAGRAKEISDDSIDFCLVDGIERDACIEAMLPKLKSGGLLVVDNIHLFLPNPRTKSPNAQRGRPASEGWERVAEALRDWRSIWTTNGVWDTALWFKP
jgi:predicted O-methyltransferase YrrM